MAQDTIHINKLLNHLKGKRRILFLTTSNRYVKHDDQPKSTALAYKLATDLTAMGVYSVKVIEIPLLNIHPCEGNVSAKGGNNCGVKAAQLLDNDKNPTGNIRCWASYNNPDDELWKVANEIFASDTVIFFASVRWGQANGYYQKLIERLDWMENRWSSLGEDNILKDKDAGLICIGQQWNGEKVVETQKKVLEFYGFKTPDALFGNWQYTLDAYDESLASYRAAIPAFEKTFNVSMKKFLQLIAPLRKRFGL